MEIYYLQLNDSENSSCLGCDVMSLG